MRSPCVLVVGGTNVDIKARSQSALVPATSNPGSTEISPGGVGRNIAENLARLGTPVRLVSAVGDDPWADVVLATTASAGVDTTSVRRHAGVATGTYTAVLAPDGELGVAVAAMEAVDALAPEDVPADLVADAAMVVLDGNVAAATAAHVAALTRRAGVPLMMEPVSVPKARRIAPFLDGAQLVTPNRDELAALTSTDGATDMTTDAGLAALHARDVAWVWLRLGAEGSILGGPGGAGGTVRVPAVPAPAVVDVTGAGDASLAAYCHAVLAGADPVEAARFGHAAAALTVASTATVRPDLTDELVRSLL